MHVFLKGNPTINAVVASLLMLTILSASYFVFEPVVAYGIADTFTVRQQITSEISWRTLAADVTMSPSLAGLTGGNSYGTTTFAINTNNPSGYNVTIAFATNTKAMQGENIASDIPNYIPVGVTVPDYNFTMAANSAGFGYSVIANTQAIDADDSFQNNSSICGAGVASTPGKCWYNKANSSTTPETIIDRATATAATGATTTLVFRVGISANPSPAIQTGYYNATATLTAVTNP